MPEQRLGTVLWRGRYLLALAVAAMVAASLVVTLLAERTYEATALLRIDEPSRGGTGSDTFNAEQASQIAAGTFATMLGSRSFLERIGPPVGRSGDELHEVVGASAIQDTSLISLTVRQGSREEARRLAGAIAGATVRALDADVRAGLDAQQREIQARIASLTTQIDQSPVVSATDRERLRSLRLARNALTEQLASVLGQGVAGAPRMALAGPPNASADPVSPRPLLNVLAGLLLGALLGVSLAWLRARTDTSLRSSKEAEELLGIPVLGSVPLRRSSSLDHPSVRNAFEVVHAKLVPPTGDPDLARIVVVTSPDAGAGKTSTALGVALAAAHAGKDVVLVDADLRRRGLSEHLGQASATGFSDAVLGGEDVPAPSPLDTAFRFRFVPAGTAVANPANLLHSAGVRRVLTELADDDRLVIVDTPPAGPLPDASILAALADEVVIVARAGTTKRDDLAALISALGQRPYARIAGLVVIEPRSDASYFAKLPQEEVEQKRVRVKP